MKKYMNFTGYSFTIVFFIFLISRSVAGETAYHDLEQTSFIKVAYKKESFELHNEGLTIFSNPQPPRKQQEQSVQFYEEKPLLPNSDESILKRVILGEDGRTRIIKTTEWPHSIHGHLESKFPDGKRYGGSGVLVGPHHVLTAAHNIYNLSKGGYANAISFYPGLNDETSPFGEANGVRIYTFNKWVNSRNKDYDMALIVLNRSVGLNTGWGGLLFSHDDDDLYKRDIHITGYPSDKKFTQMWTMSDKIKNIHPERFYYNIDTCGGQSGSGICTTMFLQPFVLGVHARGESLEIQDNLGNSGTRLSSPKISKLKKWISETSVLQENKGDLPLQKKQKPSSKKLQFTKKITSKKQIIKKRERNHTESKVDTTPRKKARTNKRKINGVTHIKKSEKLSSLLKRVGFTYKTIKDENILAKRFIKKIIAKGKTQAEIARLLGVKDTTLRSFIKKDGGASTIIVGAIKKKLKTKSFCNNINKLLK